MPGLGHTIDGNDCIIDGNDLQVVVGVVWLEDPFQTISHDFRQPGTANYLIALPYASTHFGVKSTMSLRLWP